MEVINSFYHSFQTERNMIVVTVFLFYYEPNESRLGLSLNDEWSEKHGKLYNFHV